MGYCLMGITSDRPATDRTLSPRSEQNNFYPGEEFRAAYRGARGWLRLNDEPDVGHLVVSAGSLAFHQRPARPGQTIRHRYVATGSIPGCHFLNLSRIILLYIH